MTSSMDGKFKIWENSPVEIDEEAGEEEEEGVEREDPRPGKTAWELRGEGKFLNYEARGCAISPDSSLLAVAFHQVVTLWDPNTCSLLKVCLSIPLFLQKFFLEEIFVNLFLLFSRFLPPLPLSNTLPTFPSLERATLTLLLAQTHTFLSGIC